VTTDRAIGGGDEFGFERLQPAQLTDARFDSVERTEYLHRSSDPRRLPAGHLLQRC